MGSLAALLLLAGQGPSLIDRTGDDDPAVREAASAALSREGERAVPKLIPALSHPSAEVRGRAADLLFRLPEFRWTRLLAQPDSPFVARGWNAIVDACVGKRPIPASLWREIGEEIPLERLREVVTERRTDHEPAWIVARMAEESSDALRFLADRVGVEGSKDERVMASRVVAYATTSMEIDLLARLADLGAGERAQEEIYATLVMLRREHLLPVLSDLSADDWDRVLRFLIHLRDTPGDKDPRPPRSREEALERAARGPWISGIADGLARSFAAPVLARRQAEALKVEEAEPPASRWTALARVYDELAGIDADLSGRLESSRAGNRTALPARRRPGPLPESSLLEEVCRQGPLDSDVLGVVEAVVDGVQRSSRPEIQAALLRRVAQRVVADVHRR